MQNIDYTTKSLQALEKSIQEGKWNNEGLVQLIELAGLYLNIKTIPEYAKQNKLSYNGVKKCRKITILFNTKFVIDNQ